MVESKQLEIYHIESMGTLDGPGIRTVVFLQGCPLRCDYCHNPDSWLKDKGRKMTFNELIDVIKRNQAYYGKYGGVTLSGGEPLMQVDELFDFIKVLKGLDIHVALDTSGYKVNEKIEELLKLCDLVLLDIKAFDEKSYKEISKISMFSPLKTLKFLRDENIKHWIRHVKLPMRPYKLEYLESLASHPSCEKLEILDYHTMGDEKWEDWQKIYKKDYTL